jgi:HptB-dependent secretion and biofilm anti anti-sigma factor
MKYEIIDSPQGPVLMLRDELVFSDRTSFDAVIEKLISRQKKVIVVDFSGLEYMDSAGLGMLLTLRDHAERNGMDVRLRQPKAVVQELLQLACFDSLFPID